MSTSTICPRPAAIPSLSPAALPVEIQSVSQAGKVWLEQAGEPPLLVAIKNLWKITEAANGEWPQLKMNFRATAEDGRQLQLFQDLLEGKWYRELAPLAPGQPR